MWVELNRIFILLSLYPAAVVLVYKSYMVKLHSESLPSVVGHALKTIPQLMKKATGCSPLMLTPALWAWAFLKEGIGCQGLLNSAGVLGLCS